MNGTARKGLSIPFVICICGCNLRAPVFSGRTYTLFMTCFALLLSAVLGNGSLSILCIFQAVRAEIISGKGEGGMRLELEC